MCVNLFRSILQNVTVPEVRGSAFAIFNLTDDLGKGLGPVVIDGLVSACGSEEAAYNWAISFWLVDGILLAMIFFTMESDEAVVQAKVDQAFRAESGERESSTTPVYPVTTLSSQQQNEMLSEANNPITALIQGD